MNKEIQSGPPCRSFECGGGACEEGEPGLLFHSLAERSAHLAAHDADRPFQATGGESTQLQAIHLRADFCGIQI